MSKKTALAAVSKAVNRPGEGYLVDMTVLSSDAEAMTVQLESSALPVPDRRYSCDAVQVIASQVAVRMLFAQRQPIGEELLAMLVINMAKESVVQFIESIDSQFCERAAKFVGNAKLSNFTQNASQSVVLTSSYVLAGYTGHAACIDFYNASPFSVQHMVAIKKLALEPVVRVHLSTGLLIALVDELNRVAEHGSWHRKRSHSGEA